MMSRNILRSSIYANLGKSKNITNKNRCTIGQTRHNIAAASWTNIFEDLENLIHHDGDVKPTGQNTVPTLTRSESALTDCSQDASCYTLQKPNICVAPTQTNQVVKIVNYCYKHSIPMVPVGARTGLEGGIHAMRGGVSLDMTKMNKIIKVNDKDLDCQVQAGLSWRELNDQIKSTGLWFPVDPGASATLGGMSSTSASGTNAVKYGTMRENVIGLEVVAGQGRLINTLGERCRTKKSSAGLNMTNLFVGSEGILGVITSVRLRLHPLPSCIAVATISFPDVKSAIDSVVQVMQFGIPIARIEFLDQPAVVACKRASKLDHLDDRGPMLFVEMHALNETGMNDQMEILNEIIESNGAKSMKWSSKQEERTLLWKARHNLHWSILALKPGYSPVDTDVCVPISNLCEMVLQTHRLIKESGMTAPLMGHAGDGNFHSVILHDPKDPSQLVRAKKLAEEMAMVAIELDGTVTGEHGVGRGKVDLIENQFSPDSLDLMYQVKHCLDPKNLFNPDKMLKGERLANLQNWVDVE